MLVWIIFHEFRVRDCMRFSEYSFAFALMVEMNKFIIDITNANPKDDCQNNIQTSANIGIHWTE